MRLYIDHQRLADQGDLLDDGATDFDPWMDAVLEGRHRRPPRVSLTLPVIPSARARPLSTLAS